MIRDMKPQDREPLLAAAVEAFDGVSMDQNIERRIGVVAGHDWRFRRRRSFAADLDSAARVLVFERDGAPAGYVTCKVDPAAGIGDIPHLMVAAGGQGAGVGKALLAAGLDVLRQEGMELARIDALEQNIRANRFYPAVGFIEVARKIYYVKKL